MLSTPGVRRSEGSPTVSAISGTTFYYTGVPHWFGGVSSTTPVSDGTHSDDALDSVRAPSPTLPTPWVR